MRFARFHIAVVAVLAHAFALGQQLTNTSLDALAYENGSIRNNVYTNECFVFSLAIPEGWQLKPVGADGADGKATHVAKNVLILMVLDRHHVRCFQKADSSHGPRSRWLSRHRSTTRFECGARANRWRQELSQRTGS